nr:complement decay-accelerating factor, GPI-anchored-like [Dromaius novaehollandiae]
MGPRCLRAALLPLLLLLELPGARGDCGPPPRFAFAEPPLPLNDSYPSGTSLRYRCRTGYTVASGKSPYVTCLPNSTWSAESDFCIGGFPRWARRSPWHKSLWAEVSGSPLQFLSQ